MNAEPPAPNAQRRTNDTSPRSRRPDDSPAGRRVSLHNLPDLRMPSVRVRRSAFGVGCWALLFLCTTAFADEPAKGASFNTWGKVDDPATGLGPGHSPAVVWSPELKRFVYFSGGVSHEFKGERPYDILSLDLGARTWRNELPKGAEDRGGPTGNVKDVDYKTPYFEMQDIAGLRRPNRRHMTMYNQYALAPWDDKVYLLICGRTLSYDPAQRTWEDLKPLTGPMPEVGTARVSLSWAAMCADPVNQEVVLFGGCGLTTPDGSPGTWVYSPAKNAWRKLELKVEPPPRALAPMVFDPATKKIVLFGGDRLDQLDADTWVYDCATRTWEERRPAVSPAPRFGHALLHLPKSGTIALLGGMTYTSSTSYQAMLYRPLPFEMWTYDVAGNEWRLVRRWESGAPVQHPTVAACAAASDDDTVLFIGRGEKGATHAAWTCQADATAHDAAGTAEFGVKPGTLTFRTGAFDPAWYVKDVPAPDEAAAAALLKDLPPNQWVALQAPRWPENRQGGGWSTAALDTDREQILHLGGGHSSYFGNDVAHYDIRTGRWTISYRPQFALDFNYDLSGPGPWAFNGGPWGNHNYHAYAYDATRKRLVYVRGAWTMFYDPATRTWPRAEKQEQTPGDGSKYTTYLCPTPQGMVAWALLKSRPGLWRLEGAEGWKPIQVTGEPLPVPVCDSSTIVHDTRRDRLLLTTPPPKEGGAVGQVWAVDLKSGEIKGLNPQGMDAIKAGRLAREAVYLPKADLMMIGALLDVNSKLTVPFYDGDKNRWLTAPMVGADFINRGKPGCSVDLGLRYDAARDVVWGVLCSLRGKGALNVVRLDPAALAAAPL
jgi:hypothetical protein